MPIRGKRFAATRLEREVSSILARHALEVIRPSVPSSTLREAMRVRVSGNDVSVYIPHYWAVYLHDDRRAFGPRRDTGKRWLVWFANPKDDPRLQSGKQPERYSQWRPLTEAEWFEGLAENLRRRDMGLPPFMIVRKSVPARQGDYFFRDADAEAIKKRAEAEILEKFEQELLASLPRGTQEIVIRL